MYILKGFDLSDKAKILRPLILYDEEHCVKNSGLYLNLKILPFS